MLELAMGGLVASLMADTEAHIRLLAGGDGALSIVYAQYKGFFDKNPFSFCKGSSLCKDYSPIFKHDTIGFFTDHTFLDSVH